MIVPTKVAIRFTDPNIEVNNKSKPKNNKKVKIKNVKNSRIFETIRYLI